MSRVASASAANMTPTSMFGSVGSGSLKGMSFLHAFQSFKWFQSFQPPPLSPRVAGEDEGGGLNRWNGWNLWNGFVSCFHLGQIPSQIALHQIVLVVRRKTAGRRLPDSFATHAAVFRFTYAHQSFFRHGVDGMVISLTSEDKAHESFRLMEQRIGLMHRHMPVARDRLLG